MTSFQCSALSVNVTILSFDIQVLYVFQVLKFDMKMFVNVAMLDIGHLFNQSTRRWHLYTLDTFLVLFTYYIVFSTALK